MNTKKAEWILKIGVAGEFFGHGWLAINGKKDFITFIVKIIHVDAGTAATLLFWIGVVDIILAILVLIKPIRPVLLWMALWGFWTALVRPLANGWGDWPDFVERFANWAAPLALIYLLGWPTSWREWWKGRNSEIQ